MSDRNRVGTSCLRCLAALAVGVALAVLPARADEAGLPGPSRDTELKVFVRRALHEDPKLAGLRFWVSVHRNVATLSGAVPSEAAKRRADEVARRVVGIFEVNNKLLVVPPDGIPEGPSAFPDGMPPQPEPADRKVASGALTGQNGESGRTRQGHQRPQFPDPGPEPRAPLSDAVSLGQPVPLVGSPPPPDPPAVLLPPRPLPEAPADLYTAVEALCRGEARFRGIRPEARGGVVYLRGAVGRWEDVEELAAIVRRLPGVTAVVLENITADR